MQDNVDDRLANARDFLTGVRKHKVTEAPPSVLVRECAELRRQLGQVLDVADGQAKRLDGIAAICEQTLGDELADRQYALEGIALIAGAP